VAGANTPPTISTIADQVIPANGSAGPINFTVDDNETTAGSLVVSATSSNTVLVPNGNITLCGSGANRTITVTPASSQQGVATIAVNVSDGVNNTFTTFVV